MIDFHGLKSLRRVLCLGAHSDDIEIGAGGTLLRIMRDNADAQITFVCFSGNAARHAEARASFDLYTAGRAGRDRLVLHGFADTLFPTQHQAIKAEFENLKSIDPDLILTHTREDRHQDHRVIHELTWNAFRSHPIWEYEIPKWDGDLGQPNLYVPLDRELAERKIAMLAQAFGSQRAKHWFDEETFRGLMRIRGLESNTKYAEAFHVRKMVIGS